MRKIARLALLPSLCFLSACGHVDPTPTLDSWRKFENDLAGWFDKNYGRENNMRFAATGFPYPIGSVLRRNSQSVLSSSCQFADIPPQPISAPTIPEVTSKREIDAKIDAGTYASKLLGEGSKLAGSLKFGPSLTAKVLEPRIFILAEDQTAGVLRNPSCLSAVVGQNVSVVRGYLEAKYSISSTTGGLAGADATVRSNELVKVTFTALDKFAVEDVIVGKKMVILADATVVKEVIVAGGNPLRSVGDQPSSCSERPRLEFALLGKPAPSDLIVAERTTAQNFPSCAAFDAYIASCRFSVEALKECVRSWKN